MNIDELETLIENRNMYKKFLLQLKDPDFEFGIIYKNYRIPHSIPNSIADLFTKQAIGICEVKIKEIDKTLEEQGIKCLEQ